MDLEKIERFSAAIKDVLVPAIAGVAAALERFCEILASTMMKIAMSAAAYKLWRIQLRYVRERVYEEGRLQNLVYQVHRRYTWCNRSVIEGLLRGQI